MRIHLIAAGTRMDTWVEQGFENYRKRLPREIQLNLVEIPIEKRHKNADLNRLMEKEGKRMLAAVPNNAQVWLLDLGGIQFDTRKLATQLQHWQQQGRDLALLIGGPEGLSEQCRQQAQGSWSLSALTLPHPLVRIVVAEQLYRAWTLLTNHPYHR